VKGKNIIYPIFSNGESLFFESNQVYDFLNINLETAKIHHEKSIS